MSTKPKTTPKAKNTKAKSTKAKKENLAALGLPALRERFQEATGESSRSPNRKYLIRRIEEARAAGVTAALHPAVAETPHPAPRDESASEPAPSAPETAPVTPPTASTPPKQRGRFASMTIEELQAKYLDVVGRPSQSSARDYLIWKIREAEKGRITIGPRKARAHDGEPLDVKIIPLRLEAAVVDKMDAAWRTRGIKNRMQFFRDAIGHYLAHLGAADAAALFANAAPVGA